MNVPNFTAGASRGLRADLKTLVGSGDRIVLFTLPFAAVGLAVQAVDPSVFAVGGTSQALGAAAVIMLACGLVAWAWSAALILRMVPKGELITNGPYAVVKHPLYTSVGLLVLPSAGILLGTWLGVVLGIALYVGSRLFAPAEEAELSKTFGADWDSYRRSVRIPWL